MACRRGRELGCEAIQIFVRNERRWASPPLEEGEIRAFKGARRAAGLRWAFAHVSYLVNLASPDPVLRRRSVEVFSDELERCRRLGLEFLVTHPGSPGSAGAEEGISLLARSLEEVFRRVRAPAPLVLLETTAGQGASLGGTFEQLRAIMDRCRDPERVGVCLDTCHVFAAGYDLSTPAGYDGTMEEFDRVLGLGRLRAVHLNDSRRERGSRVDRHEHIGRGRIGREGFRRLMRDPRLRPLPKVLETPKEEGMDGANLRLLRRLAGKAPAKASSGIPDEPCRAGSSSSRRGRS